MKHVILLITVLLLFACKKINNKNVIVVKDCTGTYLQYKAKDYRVCNTELVNLFANGTAVKTTFKKINECNGTAKDEIVCFMSHENEGWINVEEIE